VGILRSASKPAFAWSRDPLFTVPPIGAQSNRPLLPMPGVVSGPHRMRVLAAHAGNRRGEGQGTSICPARWYWVLHLFRAIQNPPLMNTTPQKERLIQKGSLARVIGRDAWNGSIYCGVSRARKLIPSGELSSCTFMAAPPGA
jgi:hypothetical protein